MEGGDAYGTMRLGALNLNAYRVRLDSIPDVSFSSPGTKQKAAAAKQFIENHYNYLLGLQDRKERRRALQRKVQEDRVPAEEQEEVMRNLAPRETEFMRLQRRKVGIDDFEQLTGTGVRCSAVKRPEERFEFGGVAVRGKVVLHSLTSRVGLHSKYG